MFISRQHESLQDQSSTVNVPSYLSDHAFFGASEVNTFLWGESRRIWSQDECISLSRVSSSCVQLSLSPARFRLLCQSIIAHKLFDYVVLAFIFLNCITVALERPKILQGSLVRMCPPPPTISFNILLSPRHVWDVSVIVTTRCTGWMCGLKILVNNLFAFWRFANNQIFRVLQCLVLDYLSHTQKCIFFFFFLSKTWSETESGSMLCQNSLIKFSWGTNLGSGLI